MSRFFDKVTDYTKVGHAVTADFLQMATTENGLQTLEELCGEGIENAKDAVAGLNTMLEEFITIAESAESLMDCTKTIQYLSISFIEQHAQAPHHHYYGHSSY